MTQDLEGGTISPQQRFAAASKRAQETFGLGEMQNINLMRHVAPRFTQVIESGSREDDTSNQRYQLEKVGYKDGKLTYSLTPPLASPLPYLEITQKKDGSDTWLYMYKKPDFGSIDRSSERGMIDHFSYNLDGNAQYLETITNAYNYLRKYGVGTANASFAWFDNDTLAEFPQIRDLMHRQQEDARKAAERTPAAIPETIMENAPEDAEAAENKESSFMKSVREIVGALYPTGEIGAFGQHVLLAAEAFDSPTEVDNVSRWMWEDQAEFAVGALDVSSFIRSMLSQARKNPGILGSNERLFIVSTPPMWEPTPDDEYVTLVTKDAKGAKHAGKIDIHKLNLPGGGTRIVTPKAPTYVGQFLREKIDVDLQREIDACEFAISAERDVAHRTIMMHETLGSQRFDKPLNLEIVGEPKIEIYVDPVQEAKEAEMRKNLYNQLMQHLTSPDAVTIEYYTTPGQSEPSLDREGAAWERFILLNSADGEYGIAISLLENDPDWQEKGKFRLKPRGAKDQLRMIFLKKKANILGSVVFKGKFDALIETYPDNHAGIMIQEHGQPFARPDRGRIESWENGRIFVQDPRVHVGTTDRDDYTLPREMEQEDLQSVLDMLKTATLDTDLMPTLIRDMTGGRRESATIVNGAGPFEDFLKSGKTFLPNSNE